MTARPVPTGDPDFDEFYAAYPRHKGPDDARRAYMAARRVGATHAEIMAGLARFVFSPDPHWIAYPGRWLRAGHWKDGTNSTRRDRIAKAFGCPPRETQAPAQRDLPLFRDLGKRL